MHRYLLSSFVADAAERHPDGPAAICGDETLSWQQLDRRVGQLAAALHGHGVGPGDRVGIYLHKSIESMVAVHGILRAGAAYVPIDPLAPVDLVTSIIADCGISVLVTHQPRKAGLTKLLPKVNLDTVVGIEADTFDPSLVGATRFVPWSEVAEADLADPYPSVDEDLAYVMYTSGLDGQTQRHHAHPSQRLGLRRHVG